MQDEMFWLWVMYKVVLSRFTGHFPSSPIVVLNSNTILDYANDSNCHIWIDIDHPLFYVDLNTDAVAKSSSQNEVKAVLCTGVHCPSMETCVEATNRKFISVQVLYVSKSHEDAVFFHTTVENLKALQ